MPEEGEKCLLCDKQDSTQSCRFLNKCRKIFNDKSKTLKDEVAAVAEKPNESSEEESDICFMVYEDLTSTISSMENDDISDIPDLVDDSDSEDDYIKMENLADDVPDVSDSISESDDEHMGGSNDSGPLHEELALFAKEHTHIVIVDTGASLHISPDTLGYPLVSLS